MQKSNLKNQNEILKFKTIQRGILFAFCIFILSFAFCILNLHTAEAVVRYPIAELGSCRDGRECYLYCQIPPNSPSCWSYGKYILRSGVLGETSVNITYPVAELGNCNSATECFQYCSQSSNQSACITFGKSQGLVKEKESTTSSSLSEKVMAAAKSQLGCDSKESCMAVCGLAENQEKCTNFAQKYKLKPSDSKTDISPQVIAKVKKELGCTSQTSCMTFCQLPENMDVCMKFAQKYKLLNTEKIKNYEEYKKNKENLIAAAKEQFGCESYDTCASFCAKVENRDKCAAFAQEYRQGTNKPSVTPFPNGCSSEAECKIFCQKYPAKCPGFPKQQTQPTSQPQNYISPSVKPLPTSSPQAQLTISPQVSPTNYQPAEQVP